MRAMNCFYGFVRVHSGCNVDERENIELLFLCYSCYIISEAIKFHPLYIVSK